MNDGPTQPRRRRPLLPTPDPTLDVVAVAVDGVFPVQVNSAGDIAQPGDLLLYETDRQKRWNRIGVLIEQRLARKDIIKTVQTEFGLTYATANADFNRFLDAAREVVDDDQVADVILGRIFTRLQKQLDSLHEDATSPLVQMDEDGAPSLVGTAKEYAEAGKVKIQAAKEARATMETIVSLAGLRIERLRPKQRLEVASVVGGTETQQRAVLRLLGKDKAQAPVDVDYTVVRE